MVTDNVTGLIWTQTPDTDGNGVVNADDKMTLEEADAYCNSLSYGGYEKVKKLSMPRFASPNATSTPTGPSSRK